MKGGDPFERSPLELDILIYLNDSPHPVLLNTMRATLKLDREVEITCSVFDLKDDGLVITRDLAGDHVITITQHGKHVLLSILTNQANC